MPFFDIDLSSAARYETLARIGRGGMAEVLLAATRTNGVVKLSVLKCLWPELAEDADFLTMFLDEARLSARLNHPNVVQTYDVVQHEGRLAIAMEYLDGQPLTSVLARLAGSPELALGTRLRIVTKVLAGLEYAHALADYDGTPLELVHRDVSPHNVMVTYDGHVKLLDFGVAKTLAAAHQTRPGGIKGKLAYLAPEAIRGDRVDRRADIFSVGVLLWEIVAGRRLWGRRTEGVSGAWRLATGECAPALPEDIDVPPALRAICSRALALDPAARFQTAAELGAALESVGVDASDSQARHLGALVRRAFAGERAQRRALVEFHLRTPSSEREPSATFDYATFELSHHGTTAPHERRVADRRSAAATPPPVVEPAAVAPPRRRGIAPAVLMTAGVAALALVAGVHFGRSGLPMRTWTPSPTSEKSAPAASLPSEPAPGRIAPAPTAPVPAIVEPLAEPLAEPRETQASTSHEHRERRASDGHSRRARPLDLLSDEVLDLDGEPFGPQTGSGTRNSLRD
jgi:serine/threonine-protein kinase